MVASGFDLASRIIYSNENIYDGPNSHPTNFPNAQLFEKWSYGLSPRTSPSPGIEEGTGSRQDPQPAALTAHCLKSLLRKGFENNHIVVVTPYRHHLKLLRRVLRNAGLNVTLVLEDEILTATADSFQASGPGLVADKHRVCVSMTRHTDGLIVIGDSKCAGDLLRRSSIDLLDVSAWFREKGWVVTVDDGAIGGFFT
ncbi:uncharacterized protein PAC_10503 [Phialocephala subalpina]|uniref:DNA2/NAM7 helicase-like C-terminal domain-containing protein n=1 Tax=Phialocephala subalpina TaxID=576137 RepID=A0A1L7X6G0_9HELO|nr:uncharacterized protein PAC_10503 [Phialocephala subalpina]